MQLKIDSNFKRFWLLLCGVLWLAFSASAQGETVPPDELLKTATQQMIKALNDHRGDIKKDPRVVNQLVEEILLPHIDIIATSKWVLSRHWRTASKQQKKDFIRQFRSLLLRFYSTALATYLNNGDSVISEDMFKFQPLRAASDAKRVTVNSIVHPASGKDVPIKYSLHLTRKGWKVYDVSVEGVSMVSTYRTSFDSEIKRKGLDGVIANLAEKNQRLKQGAKVSMQ